MMTVPVEGAERLAEIFREMLALSETSQSNDPQSAAADDSIELFAQHRASGTAEICETEEKPPRNESQDS